MNIKLTLTLEEKGIKQAKMYAEKTGSSLSGLVENYFRHLTETAVPVVPEKLSPLTKDLLGSVKVKEGFDYKKILDYEQSKKHGT